MYDTVMTLDQVIDVDYFMPGCPPTTNLINEFLGIVEKHVKEGAPLPPKGSVIASQKTLCDECGRTRTVKKIDKIYMPYEIDIDPEKCMLEQGVICLGPSTRAGCGAKCLEGNQPCRGCMGPTAEVLDQGGSMLSALASIFSIRQQRGPAERGRHPGDDGRRSRTRSERSTRSPCLSRSSSGRLKKRQLPLLPRRPESNVPYTDGSGN